nr:MAG TPA: hypothetical protein [Caudoviricetes sp.]
MWGSSVWYNSTKSICWRFNPVSHTPCDRNSIGKSSRLLIGKLWVQAPSVAP